MAERVKPTDSSTERTKPSDTATERTKPTDTSTERSKPTDTATERTKPTDTSTERELVGGPGYDFSQTNIFWDREDIFFDSLILHAIERTKVSDGAVERTKPTTNQCLSLTGSGYASIADVAQTGLDMGLSDFMLEMRMKLSVPLASQEFFTCLFSKYTVGVAQYEVYLSRSVNIIFFSTYDTVTWSDAWCSTSYLDDQKWHSLFFVAGRSDVTGQKIYIDGVEVVYIGQEDPTLVGNLDNSVDFAIGAEGASAHDYKLNGQTDEVRVWKFGVGGLPSDCADYISWRHSNPLAPTSHYNGGSWNTYVTNNLSAYYKLNGDYTDETANSNDLTAGGSGNTFPRYSPERSKPSDASTERVKPIDTATERTKPTDAATERTKPT